MNIYYDIDGIKIPFDKQWERIAISVSGGADSALLLYLLCQISENYNTTIHIINHIRCWKTKPWQEHDATNIYNWFLERFPHIHFKRHINFIAPDLEHGTTGANLKDEYGKNVSGDNIQQRAYAEYICHKHNISAYYNAVTRNPSVEKFDGMKERDIEPSDDNMHLLFMKHMGKYACHPFRFTTKSWVVKQYKDLNLIELFETTRSCEGTFNEIDYTTYVTGQLVPTCGKCFWCKEREWAIKKNQ